MADGWALGPIEHVTMGSLVASRLRDLIVEGRLAPGQHLIESRIAQELEVSRSPVREALADLVREGLVQSQGKRGVYVWRPTPHDVDEIISLRVMVESLAAEWVLLHQDQGLLDRLDRLLLDTQKAADAGDDRELVRLDRAFHDHMVRGARHERLLRFWEQISSQWEVLIYHRLRRDRMVVPNRVLADHRELLVALRRHDLVALVALHREFNRQVCDEIKANLAARDAAPAATRSEDFYDNDARMA